MTLWSLKRILNEQRVSRENFRLLDRDKYLARKDIYNYTYFNFGLTNLFVSLFTYIYQLNSIRALWI